MNQNIEYSGIKCDNPECNYRDDTVLFEDYPKWVNKPCPLCDRNLLTEEDYNHAVLMTDIINNMEFPDFGAEAETEIMADLKAMGITPEMLIDSFKGLPESYIRDAFKKIQHGNP